MSWLLKWLEKFLTSSTYIHHQSEPQRAPARLWFYKTLETFERLRKLMTLEHVACFLTT